MERKEFTPEEICALKQNEYVKDVKGNSIYYTERFKRHYLRQHEIGISSREIFESAGFDISLIGMRRVIKAGERWQETRRFTGRGRGRFAENEIELLRQNPNVKSVNSNRILYTKHFKKKFMERYKNGEMPTAIFLDCGFDPKMIGSKRIERFTAHCKSGR